MHRLVRSPMTMPPVFARTCRNTLYPCRMAILPELQRAGIDFIAADELTYGLEQIERNALLSLEEIELLGA